MTLKELESYIREKLIEARKELGDDANVLEICMYIYGVGLDDGAAGVKIKIGI